MSTVEETGRIAASAGLEASFQRRREGWQHQKELAERDLKSFDRQIEAARLRVQIAERSLELHDQGIEQLDEALELMDGKFTSLGLYTWLATRLRRLYRDGYQNAMGLARLAEQAFRFERGEDAAEAVAAVVRRHDDAGDQLHGGPSSLRAVRTHATSSRRRSTFVHRTTFQAANWGARASDR